jgi:hypothetical protein
MKDGLNTCSNCNHFDAEDAINSTVCTTCFNYGNWKEILVPMQAAQTAQASSIDSTLSERGARYGTFTEHARVTQNIKAAMKDSRNWHELSDSKKECLEMIAHKVGRILNGDSNYHDSWHDIVGYTKLVADELLGNIK